MTAHLTPIGAVVANVTADLEGRVTPVCDRHVDFLRRNARVARMQHAASIATELEAIAARIESAVAAGHLTAVAEDRH